MANRRSVSAFSFIIGLVCVLTSAFAVIFTCYGSAIVSFGFGLMFALVGTAYLISAEIRDIFNGKENTR